MPRMKAYTVRDRVTYERVWHLYAASDRAAIDRVASGGLPPDSDRQVDAEPYEATAAKGRVIVRQTCCVHCGLDIEGFSPFPRGGWRDRGNNAKCYSGPKIGRYHVPVKLR